MNQDKYSVIKHPHIIMILPTYLSNAHLSFPQIMVQQVYDTCMQYASVTFRIASLKSHDSGRFYCGWIDGTQTNVTYYTNVTLAVSSRHLVSAAEKISLYIAVPLASVVVVVVAVVIAVAVYRKRQRNAPPVDDQHRKHQPQNHAFFSPHPPPGNGVVSRLRKHIMF